MHSCIIDGEAIISDATGLAVFSLVRNYRNGTRATLCAFDLIEIDGQDLRWQAIEDRKAALKKLLSRPGTIGFVVSAERVQFTLDVPFGINDIT